MPIETQSTDANHAGTSPSGSIFSNRNFILLWAAYGVSALGDHLSEMGLLKLQDALDPAKTDTTRIKAVMIFVFMLPFFALGPVCGWIADRLPRKWIMIAADVVRAAIMVEMLAILTGLHRWLLPAGPHGPLPLSVAILPMLACGVFAALFSPARLSLLPTIVRPDQIVRANALTAGLGMIATIASALLGGYLVTRFEVVWNFRTDAATFVFSAFCLLLVRPPRGRHASASSHGSLAAIMAGFRYVRRHRRTGEIILTVTVFWTGAAVVSSIIPAMVKNVFGGTYWDIGLYQGLLGFGLVLGSVALTLLGPALRSELAISWSLKLAGLSGILMTLAVAFRWPASICAVGLVGLGFFGAGIQVSVNSMLQRIVPDHFRGRVFGVTDLCSMTGLLLASGLLGLPSWPDIDRHITWIMALTSFALLAVGVWTTRVRLRRGRFGPMVTFWRNLVELHNRLVARVRRDGPCTVPLTGPVIVAANHNCSLDPLLLISTSPNRYPSFMVAREYTEIPVFGRLIGLIDCIPVNRTGIDTASVKAALRHLAAGGIIGLFPQGGIRPPGETGEIHEGIGMLALRSGAVVIPAHISGTHHSDSVVAPFFRPQRAVVRYGGPIDLSRWNGREKDRTAYGEAARYIMERIEALKPAAAEG
ncbi:MAG TPA: MFS transporter [Phycisphaerae bacterium]|nr:MFS transporter [Phycisphaerae bacterium]